MPNINTSVFRVFLPFAFGYFLSYLFRVVNAVIAPDLVADLHINPSQLGLLTSTYFIAFQISIAPTFLWILFGFFGTSGILSYAALSSHFPIPFYGIGCHGNK